MQPLTAAKQLFALRHSTIFLLISTQDSEYFFLRLQVSTFMKIILQQQFVLRIFPTQCVCILFKHAVSAINQTLAS